MNGYIHAFDVVQENRELTPRHLDTESNVCIVNWLFKSISNWSDLHDEKNLRFYIYIVSFL